MHLFDRFERIVIISLPYRKDRRREMAAQLGRLGISIRDPRVSVFDAFRPDDAGGFESIGARGCFLSHLAVLQMSSGGGSVLILEDDTDFTQDIRKRLADALPALPQDWKIFYGGGRGLPASRGGAMTVAPPGVGITSSHFLAFNGGVIGLAASYLEAMLTRAPGDPRGGPMHVDGAYSHFRADHTELVTWAATPAFGHQRASRTDIHRRKWFDRMVLVRGFVGLLRRLARRSQR